MQSWKFCLAFLWDSLDPLDSRFCSIPAALGVEPIEINLLCVCVCVCYCPPISSKKKIRHII